MGPRGWFASCEKTASSSCRPRTCPCTSGSCTGLQAFGACHWFQDRLNPEAERTMRTKPVRLICSNVYLNHPFETGPRFVLKVCEHAGVAWAKECVTSGETARFRVRAGLPWDQRARSLALAHGLVHHAATRLLGRRGPLASLSTASTVRLWLDTHLLLQVIMPQGQAEDEETGLPISIPTAATSSLVVWGRKHLNLSSKSAHSPGCLGGTHHP